MKRNRLWNKLKMELWKHAHKQQERELRSRITNGEVTILSPNCTGGVMYHDLGLQFRSPTVNLYMNAEDYLSFCEDLPRYLQAQLKPYTGPVKRDYPMAELDGLTVYLVHYKSLEEAREKWAQRAQRVCWDNIVVLGTDRDGMTPERMARFDRLPYRKVMFVKDAPVYDWQFQIRGCVEENQVGTVLEPDISSWKAALAGKRYYDQMDWVAFLNQGTKGEVCR